MATTKTHICNLALRHIGVSRRLTDVDTDGTANALACLDFYEDALQDVLRAHRWPFATKYALMFWLEDSPTSEWGYSYMYPADCLKIRRLRSGARPGLERADQRVPYRKVFGNSTADRDGIAEAQTLSGAETLTLDGAWADQGTEGVYSAPHARLITIYGANNESGVTFTLTGTDKDGDAQTEALTGPNAGTVTSTGYYSSVTVSSDGATTGDVEVGGSTMLGPEIYCDLIPSEAYMEYTVDVTDVTRFSRDFVLAMSLLIASYIAPSVAGGDGFQLGQTAYQRYLMKIGEAQMAADAEEQTERPDPISEFEAARN